MGDDQGAPCADIRAVDTDLRRATIADLNDITQLLKDVHGESLDPTALLSDIRNRLYFDERGGAIFAWRGPGIYEGHSFFRVRGRDAIKAGREVLTHILDARLVWGLTPESNRPARWFNRQVGFQSQGMLETPEGPHELFVLGEPLCPLAR
jgi:hypothetical protein